MAKIRKSYLGGAASTTTSTAIASSGTNTFNITAYTGWPYGTPPFFVVLEPGTANEEKVLVTRSGATDLTVTVYTVPSVAANRGLDGTSAVAHASGSTTFPVFTATEADEANELVSTMTTKGDLLSHGTSTFGRLGVGTDTYVLKADSAQATGLVWGQVAAGGIATDAVTTAKIQDGAVTSAKIADGTIVNADIGSSAAIALSKLATGALPTAITVATANINNLAITAAKIASGTIQSTQLDDNCITNPKIATDAVQTSKIKDSHVTTAKIDNGAVTTEKLDTAAVTAAKIAAGAVTSSEIAVDAVTTTRILDGAVTNAKLGLLAVDTPQLAAESVTNSKIADDAVQNSKIKDGVVTGPKIYKNIDSFSGATYTVGSNDWVLSHTGSSSTTVTLPNPGNHTGRPLHFRNTVAFTILSASTNVTGLKTPSSATTSTILSATEGAWCELVSNGSDWIITMSSENP